MSGRNFKAVPVTAFSFVAVASTLLATFIFSTTALASPELVSSDSSSAPLIDTREIPLGYHAQDVSADGRYVLLSNYSGNFGLDANTGAYIYPNNCDILRKDRKTGELVTVFAGDPDNLEYCNGARISADGSLVATSPGGSKVSCTGGEVTALIVRHVDWGMNKTVVTQWAPNSGDIARICPDPDGTIRYPGQTLHSITGDAAFAVLTRLSAAAFGGGIYSTFEIVDVMAGSIEPITIATAEGESALITGVALSEDGTQVAVNASLLRPYPALYPTTDSATGGQTTGPSGVILCGQVGRCDTIGAVICDQDGNCQTTDGTPVDGGWWQYPYPADPPANNIYLINRISGTQTLPTPLADLPSDTLLQSNAWSADSSRLSFLSIPKFQTACYYLADSTAPQCLPADACTAADCELTVQHFATSTATLTSFVTEYDMDTLSLCRPTAGNNSYVVTNLGCTPRLSRDGNRLLYGRAVARPFGGDWLPDPYSGAFVSGDFTCVTRTSLNEPLAAPEFIECPGQAPGSGPYPGPEPVNCLLYPADPACELNGGLGDYFNDGDTINREYSLNTPPSGEQYNKEVTDQYTGSIPTTGTTEPCYTYPDCTVYPFSWNNIRYSAPVNWYVLDTPTGHTTLVSVTDKGQLFQSDGTLFSDNGNTVIYRSQDPRLQDVAVSPAAAMEENLDESCFWSPAGSRSNLRVSTNDNAGFVAESDFYVYRETPVFCPVPDPEITAQLFASDITDKTDVATMTFQNKLGWGWGWRKNAGGMETLIGNFSRRPATLISVTFEISGLGESGYVNFSNEDSCDVYSPAGNNDDDMITVRCEYAALDDWEFRSIRWKFGGPDYAFVSIKTTITANEYDRRLRNNSDADKVVIWKPRPTSWWGSWWDSWSGQR